MCPRYEPPVVSVASATRIDPKKIKIIQNIRISMVNKHGGKILNLIIYDKTMDLTMTRFLQQFWYFFII